MRAGSLCRFPFWLAWLSELQLSGAVSLLLIAIVCRIVKSLGLLSGMFWFARLAQSAERQTLNLVVEGSSPSLGEMVPVWDGPIVQTLFLCYYQLA